MIPDIRIVFRKPDGSIAVTSPACAMLEGESVDSYVDRIENRMRSSGSIPVGYERAAVVSPDTLPTERSFRNAWVFSDLFQVDFKRAQEITKDRLRLEREPMFAELDGRRAVAVRNGDSTSTIDTEAQRLADITKLADQCSTLEELKAIKVD